jgi:integrase
VAADPSRSGAALRRDPPRHDVDRVELGASARSALSCFSVIAKEWHMNQTLGWTRKHASQVWHSLEIYILPTMGPRPIDEIQPREFMALIKGIEDREAGENATRVLQRVRAVFSRAVGLGYREVNPDRELQKRNKLPHRKRTGYRSVKFFTRGKPRGRISGRI